MASDATQYRVSASLLRQREADADTHALSLTSGEEGYGPSQRALHATLKQLAPDSIEELHVIPGAPHCSTLMPPGIFPQAAQARERMAKWIEEL